MDILAIGKKEDSPEKVTAIAGKDPKYFLMADEFNAVVDKVKTIVSPDEVTKYGEAPVIDGVVHIAALEFDWKLNQVAYTNPAAYSAPINPSTDGYIRTDIVVGNMFNTYQIIQGNEGVDYAEKPKPLPNTIEVSSIDVRGAVISQSAPATGTNYVEKSELNFKKLYGSGYKAAFSITDEIGSFRIMEATSIGSISVATNNKKFLYTGKDHYLKNETAGPLTIRHNSGTGNYKYFFANGVDLVIQPGEIVHFKCRFTTGNAGYFDYIGVAVSSGASEIADINGLQAALDAKALKSYTDSQDTAKLNEAKAYSDGLITQLINGAPGDANTLKELNDKILAVQAIIGGTTADGDALVNTVAELLAVFATFPEGVDLVSLLAGKVNITDVYNALDCIVAGKVADARQVKVLNDLIVALTTVVAGKENTTNKSNDVLDISSTSKFPVWKVISDWAIGRFQPKLVAGTNVTIDITNPLAPVINASGGVGDMVLASSQTVSGLKTFLSGMFGLRNVADTFTSFFANTNTASRTYTLPNKDGTVAMISDLVGIGVSELYRSWFSYMANNNGSMLVVNTGNPVAVSGTGTVVSRTGAESIYGSLIMNNYASATTAGASCGIRNNNSSDGIYLEGFDAYFIFANNDTNSAHCTAVGMYSLVSGIPNLNPTDYTAQGIMVGNDSGDANLSLFVRRNAYSSESANFLKIDCGVAFPAHSATDAYLLKISVTKTFVTADRTSTVTLTNLVSGAVFTKQLTGLETPASITNFCVTANRNNRNTGAVANIRVAKIHVTRNLF